MSNLGECGMCHNEFPSEILHEIISDPPNDFGPVCGICALAYINETLGINREKFGGAGAEDSRLKAIEYLKRGGENVLVQEETSEVTSGE